MGTPAKHGKKRKSTATPTKKAPGSARKSRKVFEPLSIDNYRPKQAGSRVLSCGEGEQLGHPGRNVTRKPRAVDTFSKGMKFVQVAAGGVHSLVLTTEGKVYSCGINEKGTVPVQGLEAEGSTDTFSEIVFAPEIEALGKIVQITAGASFSAALTEKGSVVAWGNLRDTQGEVNVHETLKDIQKKPVVVIRHKSKEHWHIVKVEAGENHLAMLSNEGELLTFGEGSMGQLGRTTRTEHIRSKFMVDSSGTSLILRVLEKHQFLRFVDVWARGFWTIGRAEDGRLFACGLNNFGQLGVLPEVTKPSRGRGRRSASTKRRNGTQPAADGGNVVPASAEALNFDELDISAVQQASSEDSSQEAEGGDSSANDEVNREKRQKPEADGPAATDEEKKPETEMQKVEESKDNGRQQAEDNVKDNKNADNSTDDSLLDLKLDESVESAAAAAEDKSQRQNGGDAEPPKPAATSAVEPNQIASSSAAGNQQQLQQQQQKAKPKDEEMIDDSAADDQQQQQPKIIGQEEANKVALLTWAQAFPADKVWTELAGVQHIVCCNGDGELYGIGKNTDNALGLGTWEGNQDEEHWRYDTLEKIPLPEGARVAGVDATLGASICWTEDGKAYGFGCDTTGQLGLGLKDDDDKIVPTPRQIDSAHLDGFRVIAVSLADNHALFLAAPANDGMKKAEEADGEEEMPMAPAQQESEASAAPTTTQEEQQPAKEEAEEGK